MKLHDVRPFREETGLDEAAPEAWNTARRQRPSSGLQLRGKLQGSRPQSHDRRLAVRLHLRGVLRDRRRA